MQRVAENDRLRLVRDDDQMNEGKRPWYNTWLESLDFVFFIGALVFKTKQTFNDKSALTRRFIMREIVCASIFL